jgi:hypothetical protein
MTDLENSMVLEIQKYNRKFGILPNIIVLSKEHYDELCNDSSSDFYGIIPRMREYHNCKIVIIDENIIQPECYEEEDLKNLLASNIKNISKKLYQSNPIVIDGKVVDKYSDLNISDSILASYNKNYLI